MQTILQMAWRNLWRHRRRSLITAAAMAVGVALCMWLTCLTDGNFSTMFRLLVEDQIGHAQVHDPDYPGARQAADTIDGAAATLAAVDALPGTKVAAARVLGFGLLGGEGRSEGAQLVGVMPAREQALRALKIVDGAWLGEEPERAIVLGYTLAKELEVGVGDQVVAVTQAVDGSMGNELYAVRGLVKTGQTGIDAHGAFLHLRDAQELLVLPDRAHEITVLVEDREAIDVWAAAASAALGERVLVRPWWEISPQIREMMASQDVVAMVLLSLVFSVAGLGVVNTMLMAVFERTRELGVLKALGMRPLRIVALVVVESVLLAGLSLVIGLSLGLLLDWHLVVVGLDFSASLGEGFDAMGVTMEPVIHGVFRVTPVLWTVGSVLLVAVLAALWPAIRAAGLQPVDAIRAE